jgi:hypothetical protein
MINKINKGKIYISLNFLIFDLLILFVSFSLPTTGRSIVTIRIGNMDNAILVGNDQQNLGLDGELRNLQQLNELTEVLILL